MKGAKHYKLGMHCQKRSEDKITYTKEERAMLKERYRHHFQKAAWAGHAAGQYYYAIIFDDDKDDPDNFDKAKSFYWYRKSAAQNYPAALNNLAFYRDHGWCCEKDRCTALALYEKAGKLGSKMARGNTRALRWELDAGKPGLRIITDKPYNWRHWRYNAAV